ncbi:MAG: hypothetical protein D6733_00140 [Methanobacteriota archaeon]|nr:MAG: hypothetical protein D6733_00140 [Euryarchaeota archaeon]
MYHPGKVLSVFKPEDPSIVSSDKTTQVMLSMWDDNLITVLASKNISGELREGDVVLVDYRPMSTTVPVPKMVVTKILRGGQAEKVWRTYEEKRKTFKSGGAIPLSLPGAPVRQPPQSYIG